MAQINPQSQHSQFHATAIGLEADVLVIGGGPAGTWAAVSAARAGASVILADKGFCGTSGATAPSGTGIWYVPNEPVPREEALTSREALGGYLADRTWGTRVLDRTAEGLQELADWTYPFPEDVSGVSQRTSLQGPEYMRLMRKRVKQEGVKILDQSPALELLVDSAGQVAGATGIRRQTGDTWSVRAGAVIIATGGCAFLSRALGCNVLTGDGYLMGAEAGADLSGMEFSNAYGISPVYGSVTKTLFYKWATFTYEDGTEIPGAGSAKGRSIIARTLLTQPVYACLDHADADIRAAMRTAQPNFFVPHDRAGIDPFSQRFPVTLRLEGTVRGTGGLRLVDETCATSVPGLYAAGDAATREPVAGATSGGGAQNSAWALTSGLIAGASAAALARSDGQRADDGATPVGAVGLRPARTPLPVNDRDVLGGVQAQMLAYDKTLWRSGPALAASQALLDGLWRELADHRHAEGLDQVGARETAAMTATARWCNAAALARDETRGMHYRTDAGGPSPNRARRLLVGGLERVWTRYEASNRTLAEAAA